MFSNKRHREFTLAWKVASSRYSVLRVKCLKFLKYACDFVLGFLQFLNFQFLFAVFKLILVSFNVGRFIFDYPNIYQYLRQTHSALCLTDSIPAEDRLLCHPRTLVLGCLSLVHLTERFLNSSRQNDQTPYLQIAFAISK